ncbi:RNA methyltransferase substrate-binding domain-containing protein, partial [Candidatus Riflebacteria bacterium]
MIIYGKHVIKEALKNGRQFQKIY